MTTLRARCEWDGEGWVVTTVPPAPGIRARCAELHQAYDQLAQMAHLATGERLASITVLVEQITGSADIDRAADVRALRDSAAAAVRAAEAATAQIAASLRCAGFGYRDIAALLGMSSQRVRQLDGKVGRLANTASADSDTPPDPMSCGSLRGSPDG